MAVTVVIQIIQSKWIKTVLRKKKKRQHSTSCNWHSYDCNDANKTIIKSNSRLFADGQG